MPLQQVSLASLKSWYSEHRRVLAIQAAMASVLAIGVALATPRYYRATTSFIRVDARVTRALDHFAGRITVLGEGPGTPDYYAEILHSPTFLRRLEAAAVPGASGGSPRTILDAVVEADPDALGSTRERERYMRGHVLIDTDAASGVSEISVDWASPVTAAAIANVARDLLEEADVERSRSALRTYAAFAARRKATAQAALDSLEADYEVFAAANVVRSSPRLAMLTQRREVELSRARGELARATLVEEQARVNAAAHASLFTVIDSASAPVRPLGRGLPIVGAFVFAGAFVLLAMSLLLIEQKPTALRFVASIRPRWVRA